MQVQPYLMFDGRCEEAVEFYRKALDAKVEALIRFKDSPNPATCPPDSADKVMHACFWIGDSAVMATDGMCHGKPGFNGFSLTVTAADDEDAKRRFAALAEGGEVKMPLAKTFFASSFGTVADRFGVSWMVIANPVGA